MKLDLTTIGSLGRIMAEEVRAGEKAATAAVRQDRDATAPRLSADSGFSWKIRGDHGGFG